MATKWFGNNHRHQHRRNYGFKLSRISISFLGCDLLRKSELGIAIKKNGDANYDFGIVFNQKNVHSKLKLPWLSLESWALNYSIIYLIFRLGSQ